MPDRTDSKQPSTAPRKQRQDRLKSALRENLKRRKAQARGREAAAAGQQTAPDGWSATEKDDA